MDHDSDYCREKFDRAFKERCLQTPLKTFEVEGNENNWEVWQVKTATGDVAEKVGCFSGCCRFDALLRALESMYK